VRRKSYISADDSLLAIPLPPGRNYLRANSVSTHRTFGTGLASTFCEKEGRFVGVEIMESVVNSEVRELCKAVSQEEDSERLKRLLDELLSMLDERQLMASLL
jgi:type III secretory pathway component EscV